MDGSKQTHTPTHTADDSYKYHQARVRSGSYIIFLFGCCPPFLFLCFYFCCVSHSLSLPLSPCIMWLPFVYFLSFLCFCLCFFSCLFIFIFRLFCLPSWGRCFLLVSFLSIYICLLSLLFFSERVPGLSWFGPVYLVTVPEFVAD